MRFSNLILCTLLMSAFAANAQTTQMFERITYPVNIFGDALEAPFAGGLNAPQFSPADLNNDGILDLVVFDRAGGVILTYINHGTPGVMDYTYAPSYACNFPALNNWVLLRDYNNDGAADIFCGSLQFGSQEIQAFRGYFDDNVLKFEPFFFSYPNCATCNSDYIYYPDDIPGYWNNLPVASSDIPAFDDIDGDGDLDILAFPAGSTTHVWFFRNTSVEMGYGLDSLKFVLGSNCWGGFFENGQEACRATLAASPGECSEGFAPTPLAEDRSNRHPGATISTFDLEGDGDKEMVLGNISYACVGLLKNCGDADQAWICEQDTAYPKYDASISLNIFPATFILDVNNDNHDDLIAAPNAKTIGENQKCAWFYKNTASGNNHVFELAGKTLLVDEMLDLGTASHPAIADVNADGLPDLVVGNEGYYTFSNPNNASLYLFLNTGTFDAPAFTLADNDWQGMTDFLPNDYDFAPAFGDLDADGDLDLLVGSAGGGLYCYFNTAGPGAPMQFERDLNTMWVSMDVGLSSTPFITDLNQDNLPDIIIGERNGNVNYFRNTGTPTEPSFANAPTVANLGNIKTTSLGEVVGFSAPFIVDQPGGSQLLVSGAQGGHLVAYTNLDTTSNAFDLVSDTWGNIDEGNRSHPAIADLDHDGILEIVLGNFRGGLSLFKTTLVDCSTSTSQGQWTNTKLGLYAAPNPAQSFVQITVSGAAGRLHWQAFNSLGALVARNTENGPSLHIPTETWENGVYFFQITDEKGNASGVSKVVVSR